MGKFDWDFDVDVLIKSKGSSKYSEDQERDEGGRWTSGGGGGGAADEGGGDSTPSGGHAQQNAAIASAEVRPVDYENPPVDFDKEVNQLWADQQARAAEVWKDHNVYGNRPDTIAGSSEPAQAAKMMVQDQLTQATGLSPEVTNQLVNGWAATSNDNDYRAMWMQKMASEEFGVPLSDWQERKLESLENVRDATIADGLTLTEQMMTPFEAMGESGRAAEGQAFLRAQYDATQAMFKEAGITEVVLFRGQNIEANRAPVEGSQSQAANNAMESWSADESVANDFAGTGTSLSGYVEAATFPVERILSTPFTGYGCLREHEFVVLGGPGNSVVISSDAVGPGAADPATGEPLTDEDYYDPLGQSPGA